MPKRPASDPTLSISVRGTTVLVAQSTINALPDAVPFISGLLERGVSVPVAAEYARLAAKLKRDGRLAAPKLLNRMIERTAANAYWRWIGDSYAARTSAVIRAFADDNVRRGIRWLRRHALVPPYEGKTVPRQSFGALHLGSVESQRALYEPPETSWVPCNTWTLHIPPKAAPVHQDPCPTCFPYELNETTGAAVLEAFEAAWGHRDFDRVPPECFLFGQPPREDVADASRENEPAGRIVALVPPGALADAIDAMGGSVTRQPDTFAARIDDGVPDVVVIARAAGGERIDDVLETVRKTWQAH